MRAAAILILAAMPALAQEPIKYRVHDETRPQPTVVDPGTGVPPETPGKPPSDAIVLFDGKDLSAWQSEKGGAPAAWKVENGYFEVVPKTGRHPDEAGLRPGRAAAHRVDGALAGEGREPGPRQQRRLLRRRPLRDPGPRQLREQDLPRRPGGCALRPVPAARERVPQARRVAGVRHRVRDRALRRGRQADEARRARPSSTTASSCSTRRSSRARPRTRRGRRTRRTPRSCRSACRTTTTRSATATSGCAS